MSLSPVADWLEPLAQPLSRDSGINEININAPGGYWLVPGAGEKQYVKDTRITRDWARGLAVLIEKHTAQTLSATHPIMSGHMPSGERIEIVLPPIGTDIYISIRIPSKKVFRLDDYDFESTQTKQQLIDIVRDRKTLLISGGTNSGKSSFMSAVIAYIESYERLITIEDALELNLPMAAHPDQLRMVYSRDGKTDIGIEEIVRSTLRLDPDRVLVAEVRGGDAFYFLLAADSGHPGSITTVHAGSPQMALWRLATLAGRADVNMSHAEIVTYIKTVVHCVVQLSFDRLAKRPVVGELYAVEAV